MALEAAFKDLAAHWQRLAEECEQGLLWLVTQAKPDEEHALATYYVDAATDLTAAAREGCAECRAAREGGPNAARGESFERLPKAGYPRFLGTQLVLLSRSLAVVAESVQEVNFVLDSVFLGPAERETIRLVFNDETSLFLAELLSWAERATDEGRQVIQDADKDGVESFVPTLSKLQEYVKEAVAKSGSPTQPTGAVAAQAAAQGPFTEVRRNGDPGDLIPPAFRTPRVQRALEELATQLTEAVEQARPIQRTAPPSIRFVYSDKYEAGTYAQLTVHGANLLRVTQVLVQNKEGKTSLAQVEPVKETLVVAYGKLPIKAGSYEVEVVDSSGRRGGPPYKFDVVQSHAPSAPTPAPASVP